MAQSDDLTDIIDEIDKGSNDFNKQNSLNYDSLVRSISEISKIVDRNDKNSTNTCDIQDLTADLFANMSDSEMINHFLPVPGIDFNQFTPNDTQLKKGKEANNNKEIWYGDEFQPHRMINYLNPLFHLNSFDVNQTLMKDRGEKDTEQESEQESKQENKKVKQYKPDIDLDVVSMETAEDMEFLNTETESGDVDYTTGGQEPESEPEVRVIKRRKPRTYKYNPKPLQHKICRSFVPDDLKDPDYWARRKRNNEAAKKSREERRKKELETLKSYEIMKQEYSQIKIENIRLKARNSLLEKQVAEMKCKVNCKE